MTEKLKYKEGDKIFVKAELVEIDNNKETELPYRVVIGKDDYSYNLWLQDDILTDTTPKLKVPQVAIDFYNKYKNDNLTFEEWFSGFYTKQFLEDFPQCEELAEWLYDNDDKTNREREFSLATLITYGESAVEVIKEPEYKVFLATANDGFNMLKDNNGIWLFGASVKSSTTFKITFTKSELKQMGLGDVFTSSIFRVERV